MKIFSKLFKLLVILSICASLYYSALRVILYTYRAVNVHGDLTNPSILKEIAIVSTSFDKRSDVWPLQFKMLFKKWPRLNEELRFIPIYLISNFKQYDDQRVRTIAVGDDISWSDNLIKALQQIDKKYIVLLMDDHIVTEPVDEKRLIEIANLMKLNHSPHTELFMDRYYRYDGIVHKTVHALMYKDQLGSVKTSLQPGIWDKDDLLSLLRPGESAWAFESKGNKRSWLYFRPFYITIADPVFKIANLMTVCSINGTNRISNYNPIVVQNLIDEGIMQDFPKSLATQSQY